MGTDNLSDSLSLLVHVPSMDRHFIAQEAVGFLLRMCLADARTVYAAFCGGN